MANMKAKEHLSTIAWVLVLLVGIAVMLYPSVSNWWNAHTQSRVISGYTEAVAAIDDDTYDKMLRDARQYNRQLATLSSPFTNYQEIDGYENLLNISGTGVMGYITIPAIHVEIPIYHGTSAEVLNIAAGHLQGSSLPVGMPDTHAVISAHRGLPSARLFTDLDRLVVGDTFTITILDEIMTYEVEEIQIVLPDELEQLALIPGGDYVTLMTCTPYGVNSHRLLLRSRRTENVYDTSKVRISADAVQVDPMLVVPVMATPLLIALFLYWSADSRRRKQNKQTQACIKADLLSVTGRPIQAYAENRDYPDYLEFLEFLDFLE